VVPVTVAALVLIIASGFIVRQAKQRFVPVETVAARTLFGVPLGLQAKRRFEGIHVTWDRSSQYVRTARSGILKITDGASVTQLPLTQDQVRYGQYYLTPNSDDVQVSLNVISGDNQALEEKAGLTFELATPASEATMASADKPREKRVPDSAVRARQIVQPVTMRSAARRAEAFVPAARTSAPAPESPSVTASANVRPDPEQLRLSLPTPSLNALRTLHPLPVQDGSPVPAASTPAPAQSGPAPEISNPALNTHNPATAALRQPTPAPSTGRQNIPISGSPGVVSTYVPPSALRQSVIVLPDVLKATVRIKPQEVDIVAQLDNSGRVKSVRPKQFVSGLQEHLVNVAKPSLMGWRFRPAMLGDKPVESEITLHLKFGGPAR